MLDWRRWILLVSVVVIAACGGEGESEDGLSPAETGEEQSEASARRSPPAAPGAPGFSSVSETSVTVTWSAARYATAYSLERAPDAGGIAGTFSQIASNLGATRFDDSGLSPGGRYWYRTRASNSYGLSPWSTATAVTLLAPPIVSPDPVPDPTPTPPPDVEVFGAELFVSPSGNDSNPGTIAQPFLTLERARTAVRSLKASPGLPEGGVAVTLRGGTYYRTSTFILASGESGTAGRPVVWRAHPGELVRISGGKRITGWSAVTSSDPNWRRIYSAAPLYKATLGLATYGDGNPPQEGGAHAELFYRGVPMQLGRWPNEVAGDAVAGMRPLTGSGASVTSTVALPARDWAGAAAQAGFNRPWLYVNTNGYLDQIVRVDGVSGNTLALQEPVYPLNAQALWYAMNLLEEVDAPGEYWIDRVAGTIYFRPPDDLDPDDSGGEAIASSFSQALVQANSTSSYLRFEGITFEAGQRDLLIVNGANNAVRGCTFRNSANSGLIVAGAGHTIDRVVVTDIGHSGVDLMGPGISGPNADTQNASSGVVFANGEVRRVGRYLHNGVAGMRLAGSGHVVRNSEFHDLPWSAIFHFAKSTVIELNRFRAAPNQGSDVGTIYTWQNQNAATAIRFNLFHEVPRAPYPWSLGSARVAVYLDQDSSASATTGFHVHGNVVHRYGDGTAGSGSRGIGVENKGSGNVFQDNLFARCDLPYVAEAGGSGTVSGNQAWLTGTLLPAGNTSNADPGFLDEGAGNLANQADGTLRLVTGAVIPFAQTGILQGP